ncbi:MAG: hypothetical protein R3Y27_08350, partial [Clostridia bacterium]
RPQTTGGAETAVNLPFLLCSIDNFLFVFCYRFCVDVMGSFAAVLGSGRTTPLRRWCTNFVRDFFVLSIVN